MGDLTSIAWQRAAEVGTPKRRRRAANPFGLTDRQAEAIALFARWGDANKVAEAMSLSRAHDANRLLDRAARRMRVENRMQAVLQWDRAVRESHRAIARGSNSVFALGAT